MGTRGPDATGGQTKREARDQVFVQIALISNQGLGPPLPLLVRVFSLTNGDVAWTPPPPPFGWFGAGTSWYQLVPAGTCWYQLLLALAPAGSWYHLVLASTSWYQLLPAGTCWYQLVPAGTSWIPAGYKLGTS